MASVLAYVFVLADIFGLWFRHLLCFCLLLLASVLASAFGFCFGLGLWLMLLASALTYTFGPFWLLLWLVFGLFWLQLWLILLFVLTLAFGFCFLAFSLGLCFWPFL